LTIAVVMAAGTLWALARFQSGATLRATYGLAGTWAVVLLLGCAWLLPAAEPYRLSPLVARGLAELARAEQAQAMLTNYKPPSVVYGFGRPLPVFAGVEDLVQRVRRDGPVVTALTGGESRWLAADARLTVEPRGVVRGFDVEHARNTTLHLVVVRPAAASGPVVRAAFEEPQVE
jgi:hypothetical protein